MVTQRARAWRGIAYPIAAAVLLLPLQRPSVGARNSYQPTGIQFRHYASGLSVWQTAQTRSGQERAELLRKAELHFDKATSGKKFPEALLALGLVRYSLGQVDAAEAPLTSVSTMTQGATRAEALTYVGFIELRRNHWQPAKDSFEAAIRERVSDVDTSARGSDARTTIESLRARGERSRNVARVGSVMASYYALRQPGRSVTEAERKALLVELDRLLPGNELPGLEQTLRESDAAVWMYAAPQPDWKRNLAEGRPEGVQSIYLSSLVRSIRIWAAAEDGTNPDLASIPATDLTPTERKNIAAGLARQALRLEEAGKTAEALSLWGQLSAYPETALAARQHCIYLLLQPAPGASVPTPDQLNRCRELIRGPLAAEDPLLYEEQLALASTLQRAAGGSGSISPDVIRQAQDEYRLILSGLPGMGQKKASDTLQQLAEANLAALVTTSTGSKGPEFWDRSLKEYPPADGREEVRLHMAMQLAEASLRAGRPADVERALSLADLIVSGKDGGKSDPVEDGAARLGQFRRHLARLALDLKVTDPYRNGFLKQTDYAGQWHAHEAARQYTKLQAEMKAQPAGADHTAAWKGILTHLQEARDLSGPNAELKARLAVDIAVVNSYINGLTTAPPQLTLAWNAAGEKTNNARSRADWDTAAQSWRQVLASMENRPAPERREVALHVVNASFKEADTLFRSGDKNGARLALRDVRDLLATGPTGVGSAISAEDKAAILRHIDNNAKALNPAELLVPARKRNIPAYSGGMIKPLRAEHVLIRYTQPHNPSVQSWLARLDQDPATVRRLVHWFNNGPIAQQTPDAKRDFSANPNSPNYLVRFLRENVHSVPGQLLAGERQWHDHSGKGPWKSATVNDRTAAYYLSNGVALIRAACSNPLTVVRVQKNPARWTDTVETVTPRETLKAPSLAYQPPTVEFVYSNVAAARAYQPPKPVTPVLTVVAPAPRVLAEPRVMPEVKARCTPIGI